MTIDLKIIPNTNGNYYQMSALAAHCSSIAFLIRFVVLFALFLIGWPHIKAS